MYYDRIQYLVDWCQTRAICKGTRKLFPIKAKENVFCIKGKSVFEDRYNNISFSFKKARASFFFFCHRMVCNTVSQSGKKKKNIKKQTIYFLFSTSTFLNIINVIGIVLNMYSYQWCFFFFWIIDIVIYLSFLRKGTHYMNKINRQHESFQHFEI